MNTTGNVLVHMGGVYILLVASNMLVLINL